MMGEEERGGDERGVVEPKVTNPDSLYRDSHRTTNGNTRVKPSSPRFTLGLPCSLRPHPVCVCESSQKTTPQ